MNSRIEMNSVGGWGLLIPQHECNEDYEAYKEFDVPGFRVVVGSFLADHGDGCGGVFYLTEVLILSEEDKKRNFYPVLGWLRGNSKEVAEGSPNGCIVHTVVADYEEKRFSARRKLGLPHRYTSQGRVENE